VALIVHSAVSNPTPKVLEILSRRESDIYVCELIDETLTFDDMSLASSLIALFVMIAQIFQS